MTDDEPLDLFWTGPPERSPRLIWWPEAKRVHRIIILSADILWAYTHYWRRQTVPCLGDDCDLCVMKCPKRRLGWIGTMREDAHYDIGVLELSEASARQLHTYAEEHRTLRGAKLVVRKKKNGRVEIKITPGKLAEDTLPPAPDARAEVEGRWKRLGQL